MPIVLISPAKTLDETPIASKSALSRVTAPRLRSRTATLLAIAAKLSSAQLRSLMSISAPLADLNRSRYAAFETQPEKACAFAFDGPAFRALDAPTMDEPSLDFAQRHVRCLSGLYGLLRPFDAIRPHRLEMGTKLATGGEKPKTQKKDLYEFWGDAIAELIVEDLMEQPVEERFVVNCASAEYFKVWFELKLVPIRPRRCGERRSLRTFPPGASLRIPLAFNPDTPRRLSTPLLTPFNSTPTSPRMERPFKSVRADVLERAGIATYTCVFPGPSVHAKAARGAMARHVAVNKITRPEGLKAFRGVAGEWSFAEETKPRTFVFKVRSIHWSPYDRVGVVNAVS